MKKVKKSLKKKLITVSTIIDILAISMLSVAADTPEGVDTTAYNSMVDIIFWLVGIAIAAIGGVPSIVTIVEGVSNEDKRGRNSGIGGLIITGACIGATFAIKKILF